MSVRASSRACSWRPAAPGRTRIVDAYGLPDSTRAELSIDTCGATVLPMDIEETADEITILVSPGGEGQECLSTVAELDEPLGDRRAVDVSTGDEVEVSPADG